MDSINQKKTVDIPTQTDTFVTIGAPAEAIHTEQRSKFLAFAMPVSDIAQVDAALDVWRKRYYDARHVCYAYMIGADGAVFRANDDGEPSGTAGRPILGQIRSAGLTNILIIVVRYFGGIKLGTGGLIVAYRTAAALAIRAASQVEKTVDDILHITFDFSAMNDVMRIIKEESPLITAQHYDLRCTMTLSIRRSQMPRLRQRLTGVDTLLSSDADDQP